MIISFNSTMYNINCVIDRYIKYFLPLFIELNRGRDQWEGYLLVIDSKVQRLSISFSFTCYDSEFMLLLSIVLLLRLGKYQTSMRFCRSSATKVEFQSEFMQSRNTQLVQWPSYSFTFFPINLILMSFFDDDSIRYYSWNNDGRKNVGIEFSRVCANLVVCSDTMKTCEVSKLI